FFDQARHLRFKLVFLDCGVYPVVAAAINAFWPRIVPGGILVLDQYGLEVGPGETRAVDEFLPNLKIETIPGAWMPTAYIQKPYER
ncbi:MAG: class I SAM-dependent methyltransferase, partial [Rickettsiales bacterium]|nr:class I SAM-dependent methyltransferase [Rickettsiales bacterium]